MGWVRICATDDISEERPFGGQFGGQYLGIFLSGGRHFALDDVCPHAFALLSDGWVADGVVECPLHGARFTLETGSCRPEGLSCGDARRFELRVEGSDIMVLLPDGGAP